MGRPKEITDQQILVAARRCFLERGAAVSAVEIGRELGVSHTTLFNRFGSKDGLMLAALGPPKEMAWVDALEAGPDDERPIRAQLVEHAKVMSAYFHDLQAGLGVLQAAGIDPAKAYRGRKKGPAAQALRALVGWLERAQKQGRIGRCDIPTLASTILGALHGWAFTARVCGESTSAAASDRYVDRFIELLWSGIGEDGEK
jgi:AcrR family transcriptional regulator